MELQETSVAKLYRRQPLSYVVGLSFHETAWNPHIIAVVGYRIYAHKRSRYKP